MMKGTKRRQRGVVIWVVLALLVAGVGVAWKLDSSRREAAAEASRKQAEQERLQAEAERQRAEQEQQRAELERQRAEAERRAAEQQAQEQQAATEKAQRDAVQAAQAALDATVRKWVDAVRVADTTGRIALAGPVSTMQAIRREAASISVPACLIPARTLLVRAMDATVNGYLAFMSNESGMGRENSRGEFRAADIALAAYREARAACGQ